jgi:hypothetical protein
VKAFFNTFESINTGKDANGMLKLLAGRAVLENVIMARGGEEACHRKFDN